MINSKKDKIKEKLSNFSQKPIANYPHKTEHKHGLSGDYDMWRLARFIFDDILSYEIADQPMEKVNWSIFFVYKESYHCRIAHMKFGFRIFVNHTDSDTATNIAKEIEEILSSVILDSRSLIEDYASTALKSGEIIVNNAYNELLGSYSFFKESVAEKSRIIETKPDNFFELYRDRSYLEAAANIAFFSLFENLCVLLLGFKDIPERNDIASFTRLIWRDKYKKVFDLNVTDFKGIYDHLISISKYKRNPSAHGFTDTVFNFYLKGARHKVNIGLSDNELALQYNNQENNFEVYENFLALLRSHDSVKNAFAYIEAGLNVSFIPSALKEHDEVNNMSDKELEEYIHFLLSRYDDMANMDW